MSARQIACVYRRSMQDARAEMYEVGFLLGWKLVSNVCREAVSSGGLECKHAACLVPLNVCRLEQYTSLGMLPLEIREAKMNSGYAEKRYDYHGVVVQLLGEDVELHVSNVACALREWVSAIRRVACLVVREWRS